MTSKTLTLGLSAFVLSTGVNAAIIHLEGDTIDVYYDDTREGNIPYGEIYIVGDTIFATPSDFRAQSNSGTGIHTGVPIDSYSSYGVVHIQAKEGYQFVGVNVGELGDYSMSAGSNSTNASVSVTAEARVFDWSSGGGIFGTAEVKNLTITGDFNDHSGQNVQWRGDASFDLSTSAWNGITDIGLGLQNNLSAFSSGDNISAWIQKKAVGGDVSMEIVTIPEIPLPAAVWLFGSGLIGLAGFARRKKS